MHFFVLNIHKRKKAKTGWICHTKGSESVLFMIENNSCGLKVCHGAPVTGGHGERWVLFQRSSVQANGEKLV